MADAQFLTPDDGVVRPAHQWSPPQHPDVTDVRLRTGERSGGQARDQAVVDVATHRGSVVGSRVLEHQGEETELGCNHGSTDGATWLLPNLLYTDAEVVGVKQLRLDRSERGPAQMHERRRAVVSDHDVGDIREVTPAVRVAAAKECTSDAGRAVSLGPSIEVGSQGLLCCRVHPDRVANNRSSAFGHGARVASQRPRGRAHRLAGGPRELGAGRSPSRSSAAGRGGPPSAG
jgi:hypothetical protein